MKAEEREELKQNDMVEWFQVGLPLFLRQNGSYLLLALALGLLGWQLWGWHEKKQAAEVMSAWNEFEAASGEGVINAPQKLQAVINQYNVKAVQAMSWVQVANFYLDDVAQGNPPEGYNGVKIGKADALAKAEEAAKHVINEFPDQPLAVGKAHLALGAAALDREDWDGAAKQYELIADKNGGFAGTAFALEAAFQLSHIADYRKAPRLTAMVAAAVPATQSTMPLPSFESPMMGPAATTQAK